VCGIIGYVGWREAPEVLLKGLRQLEYRGYDSAGLAIIGRGGLEVRKTVGKIVDLERVVTCDPLRGQVGIGHTRWATHGQPSTANAHPHLDCHGRIAVVHNGIIENHAELRAELEAGGHRFQSETDTEVVAHLIEEHWVDGLGGAVARAVARLRGEFALVILSPREANRLLVTRRGTPPLAIGVGKGECLVASDFLPLMGYVEEVVYLDEGDIASLKADGLCVQRPGVGRTTLRPVRIPWDGREVGKGDFPHFMLKEIHEQPGAVRDTFAGRMDAESGQLTLAELDPRVFDLQRVARITFVACGTSWHAALVAKFLVEELAGVPAEVDYASELRYRRLIPERDHLSVAITQSGETADTLAAMQALRAAGSRILAICNVPGSSATRLADATLLTRAGPEIGVASTKAFTAQLTALYLLALGLAQARGRMDPAEGRARLKALVELPYLLDGVLARNEAVRQVAERLADRRDFLYLGRGITYPVALEGALKLKEISYVHAEGYPAGEMKHGPIALIDEQVPVVALAPRDRTYDKMLVNIEEVQARGGYVIAVGTEGDEGLAAKADTFIPVPRGSEYLMPALLAVPLQLLAYHIAVLRGCDVDQPRNLAKSVTVE
jgi:glucosamine--fructose-6-phosphate aminotransferase (isomerizing)